MTTIFIILVVLVIIVLGILAFSIRMSTNIGEKGNKNMRIRNVLFIIEGILTMTLSLVWITSFESNSKIYILFVMFIGLVFLISGVIDIKGILKESSNDLVTEELSDVKVIPAGYHNRDRKLEGMVNGDYRCFMIRGVDKAIAEQIKTNGLNNITVTYHSSNHRIESISIN